MFSHRAKPIPKRSQRTTGDLSCGLLHLKEVGATQEAGYLAVPGGFRRLKCPMTYCEKHGAPLGHIQPTKKTALLQGKERGQLL